MKVQNVRTINPVTIELGGKLRTLQFDMNAFGELENKFGSVEKAMEQMEKGKMSDIKTILWVSLIHEEVVLDEVTGEPKGYKISPYQVGSWVKNISMLSEVSNKLAEALSQGMPAPEEETQAKNK